MKKSESDKVEAGQSIDIEDELNARRSSSLSHVQYLSAVDQRTQDKEEFVGFQETLSS